MQGRGTEGDTEPQKQGTGRGASCRADLPTAFAGYHGNDESESGAALPVQGGGVPSPGAGAWPEPHPATAS